jgi:hypothetical protein
MLILVLIVIHYFSYSQNNRKILINWGKPRKEIKKPIKVNLADTTKKEIKVEPKKKILDSTSQMDVINKFLNKWLGVKYKFGGTTKNGIDCSAFSRLFYKEIFSATLPRTCVYQYKSTKRVEKDSLKTGDLLFFRTHVASTWHVGVFLRNKKFVHASGSGSGVKISSINEKKYNQMFLSGGRL